MKHEKQTVGDIFGDLIQERIALRRRRLMEAPLAQAQAQVQPAPAPQPQAQPKGTPTPPNPNNSPQAQQQQADDKEQKLQSGQVEASDIVEKLNAIRAGRSFKDQSVSGPLQQYLDGLETAEKVALYAFLSGIAQVSTGEVPDGATATEPKDPPADVSMKKQGAPQVKGQVHSVKPTVQRAAPQARPVAGPENTAPPKPIQPRAR